MLKPRKIPMRQCTGCREMKNKKDLIRVVRTDDDKFSLDYTGKKSGRGAYVCPSIACFEKAFKQKGFDRSFSQKVPVEIYELLKMEMEKRETV